MPKIALRHILKDDIIAIQPDDNHSVVLVEPQNENKPKTLQEVKIVDIPDGTIILCADKMSSPLFNENDTFCSCHEQWKYRKKCDYIIISEIDNKNYIIYIEMKTTPREKKHIPQLWCGRSFMEYLNFAMEHLENIKPDSEYLHRFVKFCKIPEDKDSTDCRDDYKETTKPNSLNDLPGNAYSCYVIDGNPIALKELLYDFNH